MVFDPSKIKERKVTPETLPEGASREEKILALANILQERGLASSLSAAKRLAEGMVDTERKVIDEGGPSESHSQARAEFQSADSQLFKAVGGVPRLDLSEQFQQFVEKAAPLQETKERLQVQEAPQPVVREEPPTPAQSDEKLVFHEEAPDLEKLRVPEEEWKVPEKEGDQGYAKTMVESSDEGVVVRHVEATANTDVVSEQGVILEDESLKEEASAPEPETTSEPAPQVVPVPEEPPEKKKQDLAKEQGIDLFDIFKSGE